MASLALRFCQFHSKMMFFLQSMYVCEKFGGSWYCSHAREYSNLECWVSNISE